MHRDAGHPDYQRVDMKEVEIRARELAPTDDATIPNSLLEVLGEDGENDDNFHGVDKAATPAERISSEMELEKEMNRARPLLFSTQRDSDAQREVEASRVSALSSVSQLEVRTGSDLIDQFKTEYIPRVFNLTMPWCVGGPDFRRQKRYRRSCEDSAFLSLDAFTSMMARRVESQFRWDWDLNPSLWSLTFSSKVNLGLSMCSAFICM